MTDAAIADLTPTTAPSWEPPPAVARRIARGTTPVVGPEPVTRVRLELPLPLPVQVRPAPARWGRTLPSDLDGNVRLGVRRMHRPSAAAGHVKPPRAAAVTGDDSRVGTLVVAVLASLAAVLVWTLWLLSTRAPAAAAATTAAPAAPRAAATEAPPPVVTPMPRPVVTPITTPAAPR